MKALRARLHAPRADVAVKPTKQGYLAAVGRQEAKPRLILRNPMEST